MKWTESHRKRTVHSPKMRSGLLKTEVSLDVTDIHGKHESGAQQLNKVPIMSLSSCPTSDEVGGAESLNYMTLVRSAYFY